MAKKKTLPFDIKRLDRGSGKLYEKLKHLGREWRKSTATAKRKKEIEAIYKACLKEWDRLKDRMRKFGIHIGNLD